MGRARRSCFVAIPALMAVFVCVWDERKYYLTSLLLVGLMFVPFVLRFEGRRPQARELVLLATMTALAVAGRAAFYWLPQCKPVCAIVILTAVAFTPEAGFVTGAAAGLISNFFFGQGPWTPWQMLGFGLVGFLGGVLFAGTQGAPRAAAALRLFLGVRRSTACCSTRRVCSCITQRPRGSSGLQRAHPGSFSTSSMRAARPCFCCCCISRC